MDIKVICENKFQFKNQTIALPVRLENLPSQLLVEDNILFLKESFHVSLVCIGKIIEKYNIFIPDFEEKIINDFCEFSKANDIQVLKYNDFKFSTENELRSVIVMCQMSNLDKFFKILNKKYNLNVEYPPTHVTLYTRESKPGIYLTDANDIENLTKPIPNPIGHVLEF